MSTKLYNPKLSEMLGWHAEYVETPVLELLDELDATRDVLGWSRQGQADEIDEIVLAATNALRALRARIKAQEEAEVEARIETRMRAHPGLYTDMME